MAGQTWELSFLVECVLVYCHNVVSYQCIIILVYCCCFCPVCCISVSVYFCCVHSCCWDVLMYCCYSFLTKKAVLGWEKNLFLFSSLGMNTLRIWFMSTGLIIVQQQDGCVQENFPFTMFLKPDPALQPWKLSLDHSHAPLSQLSQWSSLLGLMLQQVY